jgi:hypothetical protein
MATNNDGWRAFLQATLGATFGSVQDLTAAFIAKFPTGLDTAYVSKTAPSAAIVTPTAPSAAYVQAEATAMKTAVDAIRASLLSHGITS